MNFILDGRDLGKLDIDELDELEDSEDEAILLEYRKKRMAELKELVSRSRFGSVREITGEEYINEVSFALRSNEFRKPKNNLLLGQQSRR